MCEAAEILIAMSFWATLTHQVTPECQNLRPEEQARPTRVSDLVRPPRGRKTCQRKRGILSKIQRCEEICVVFVLRCDAILLSEPLKVKFIGAVLR